MNSGPGSFSTIRVSIAVAKGIHLSKNSTLYGFKNPDLIEFSLENIDKLIKKKFIRKKFD